MLRKIKILGLSLSFVGSLFLAGMVLFYPSPAQAAVVCVPVCNKTTPCFCPVGQQCVIWVSPVPGSPCFSPNTNCNRTCIGPAC